MSDLEYILAVDLGTGGPKVAIVSTSGEVVVSELTEIPTKLLPNGGATQDPNSWWDAIKLSTRHLFEISSVSPNNIVAISTTGQWGSTVGIDENGKVVTDCILWMDSRGEKYSREVLAGIGPLEFEGFGLDKAYKFVTKTGGIPALQGNDPLGHYLLLKNEYPEIFNRVDKFLEPVDFLTFCFTGEKKATPASMILSWLVDIRDLSNASYVKDLIDITQRDESKLPQLIPIGSVAGGVTQEVSNELGIKAGIPVVSGTPDLLSACTGSGGLDDYEFHMAISTTSWLSCQVGKKKTDPFRQIATVPGPIKNRYMLANNHDTAGICLQWIKQSLYASSNEPKGEPKGGNDKSEEISYKDLDGILKETSPGANGTMFTPWLGGERCPIDDRHLRGSFLNLSLETTKAEMLRAVYEGVAFNAKWMQDAVEHFVKRPTGPIRFIGGGAVSSEWCQIHADIMNTEILQVDEPLYANVRGAALFASLYLSKISIEDIKKNIKIKERFVPQPKNRKLYDLMYGEFKKIYKSQKAMYKSLNSSKNKDLFKK
jgi:xylulokinase